MNKLIFIKEAKNEIQNIYDYYEAQQKKLGQRFKSYLDEYFITLKNHPESFAIKKYPFREIPLQKFPFVIIYEFIKEKDLIIIYAIFNTRQNPTKKPY